MAVCVGCADGCVCEKAREGEMTHMIGDGSNVVDFTYIDNVILAHVLASEHLVQHRHSSAAA